MPIYEYKCEDCTSRFEALVMGSEPEPERCDCGSQAIEKVYSTFSAQAPNGGFESCPAPDEGQCGAPACGGGMCGMN